MKAYRAVFLLAMFFTLCMPLKGDCATISEREAPRGMTDLMVAAGSGHSQAVKILLENKASLHAITNNGFTALDFARNQNHTDIVKLLEQYGAQ